jgi:hypothetical protein
MCLKPGLAKTPQIIWILKGGRRNDQRKQLGCVVDEFEITTRMQTDIAKVTDRTI